MGVPTPTHVRVAPALGGEEDEGDEVGGHGDEEELAQGGPEGGDLEWVGGWFGLGEKRRRKTGGWKRCCVIH